MLGQVLLLQHELRPPAAKRVPFPGLGRLAGRDGAATELLREHRRAREARGQGDRERHEVGVGVGSVARST